MRRKYISFIMWAYSALFSQHISYRNFPLPCFVFFLPIDDALHVEVPVVGGNMPLHVHTSCIVRHTVPSTFDFVRFDEDNASKFNGPKSTVPSSDNWTISPHWIYVSPFGVNDGQNRIRLLKIISLLLVSLDGWTHHSYFYCLDS